MNCEYYITVRDQASDECVINKSRFIGYACPCESEKEALSFLKTIREKHRDATHHCFAYIIGLNSGIIRYSDDGEPAGTAGLPIVEVMRSRSIVNCCVVVVRYFGGTLLGTGGLVTAYTQGCKIALDAAVIVRMELTSHFLCDVPYSFWDTISHSLKGMPAKILDPEFGTSVSFLLSVRICDQEKITETLRKITGGKIVLIQDEAGYEPWELNESGDG